MTVEDILKRQPKNLLREGRKTLIDTSADKFQQSPGLLRWANVHNLKAVASAYAASGTISKLQEKIVEKKTLTKTSRESLIALEKKMNSPFSKSSCSI